jgi:hypothetical protein
MYRVNRRKKPIACLLINSYPRNDVDIDGRLDRGQNGIGNRDEVSAPGLTSCRAGLIRIRIFIELVVPFSGPAVKPTCEVISFRGQI